MRAPKVLRVYNKLDWLIDFLKMPYRMQPYKLNVPFTQPKCELQFFITILVLALKRWCAFLGVFVNLYFSPRE